MTKGNKIIYVCVRKLGLGKNAKQKLVRNSTTNLQKSQFPALFKFYRFFNVFVSLFLFSIKAKGWYSHNAALSCKDIRDSGDSKGDGEYWIDPENNGNPLKVYCDMTTGGGEMQMKQVTRKKNNQFTTFVCHV